MLLRVDKVPAKPGAPVLEIENLRVVDDKGVERLKGVSLNVKAGEILGIPFNERVGEPVNAVLEIQVEFKLPLNGGGTPRC